LIQETYDKKRASLPPDSYGTPDPYYLIPRRVRYAREKLNRFEQRMRDYVKADIKSAQDDVAYLNHKDSRLPSAYGSHIKLRTKMKRLVELAEILGMTSEIEQGKAMVDSFGSEMTINFSLVADQVIAWNRLPPDNYKGKDRELLLRRIQETWNAASPHREPVHIGLESRWRELSEWSLHEGRLYQIERWQNVAYVLVPRDEETLLRYSVQLRRDRAKSDYPAYCTVQAENDNPVDIVLIDSTDMELSLENKFHRTELTRHLQQMRERKD
jgi:hypothetical protein